MTFESESTHERNSTDSRSRYQRTREAHWDAVADRLETWTGLGGYYQRQLSHIYRHLVPAGSRILEIGCGQGDLLASLSPSVGVGVDLSSKMIRRAERRYPHLRWMIADAHHLELEEPFDAIILSDLVNDIWDVQLAFEQIVRVATPRTRIILNTYSQVWQPILALAQKTGLSKPALDQNWLTVEDLAGLFDLSGASVIRSWSEVLCPLPIPVLQTLANRYLAKIWPFRMLDLTNFIVARVKPSAGSAAKPRVSVIVPARNEAGNISRIIADVPEMGAGTEIVLVEGHSGDDTYAAIERQIALHPERCLRALQQTGKGKGDAVRLGFAEATGDVLMILDADLTVPPEDLRRFYDALVTGNGEFVNGVRLVYPMEKQAMRFANLVGNKFFSLAFSWLLGQTIKDTLCGTKVLWKVDYERIAENRAYFGDFDPFGDFDLLFGAARLNLKIVEIPVRYRERSYGATNIQRWRHGWLLLKMVVFAAGRIKFT